MTDVKTTSITQIWQFLSTKPVTYKTKYIVLLLMSNQSMGIMSLIHIKEFTCHKLSAKPADLA
jgi:hypothetical protein